MNYPTIGQLSIYRWMLAILFMVGCTNSSTSQIQPVNNQQLAELLKRSDLQLVDVRTTEETAHGMIAGAKNIDFRSPDFETFISQLNRDQPIAVYCGVGGRSGKTSQLLLELGFKEIYDLTGGFTQWESEQFPVVTPE